MVDSSSPAHRHAHVFGTLMPHLAAERHHLYRNVTALALLAALIAAGTGSLAVALVLAAVALPAAVLTYIHDHGLWRDEPITVIAVAFGLSLLLGVGVGLLETQFITLVTSGASEYQVPPVERIVEVGLLVPLAAFVAVVLTPLLVSARPAFRHPMDVVVACTLAGAALSLGLSVVVQHGAFTHIQATAGDPAHVAFIAITLGVLQPVVLSTAATVAVLGVRRLGVSPVTGVLQGLVLVVAYELATTLLQPYGTRGLVLTAVAAFVLAGAGLAAARRGLHAALLADGGAAAPADPAEHRLHSGAVTGIVAAIVAAAAVVAVVVALGGPAAAPTPPGQDGGPRLSGHHATTSAVHRPADRREQERRGSLVLASTSSSLAAGQGNVITLVEGISLTLEPGWAVASRGPQSVTMFNSDKSAGVYANAGSSNTDDIRQEAAVLIAQNIRGNGLTNIQEAPGAPITIDGKTFQQEVEDDYTANVETDQGTIQVWGAWVVMFSPTNHRAALYNMFASSKAQYDASLPSAGAMMVSMR
jgi:hypothetical protein